MLRATLAFLLVPLMLVAILLSARAADYDHRPTIGPAKGSLVIVGGGEITQEIKQRFVALAGGADANFVFIPTAAGDGQIDQKRILEDFSRSFGVSHVTVLHTRDRNQANSTTFGEPLRNASGVWIEGGRQWRLADAYLGTAVETEIKALLARGGVVGGSSAGATIQGSYLVRGASATANNPDGDNTIMMAPGHEAGFALVSNIAIDQHVIVRHRENDLDPVIAAHPKLLGVGIDQGAAIIVHGDVFETMSGKVLIHDGKRHGDKGYYVLSPGQKFNLRTRKAE